MICVRGHAPELPVTVKDIMYHMCDFIMGLAHITALQHSVAGLILFFRSLIVFLSCL